MKKIIEALIYLWTETWVGVVLAIVIIFLILGSLDIDFGPGPSKPSN